MIVSVRGLLRTIAAVTIALALVGGAAANTITGPSSSQSPYVVRSVPGVVTKAILTVGDSPVGSSYRMAGIPDGLGAFDNRDGTFTLLMNHELGSSQGEIRAHGARGAFLSKWTIEKGSLRVLQGEDLIKKLYTWSGATWQLSNSDAAPTRLNRLCSADLPPISAFYNPASGNGYNGRIFMDGEEGGTTGRPWGHVVATGESYELTPWLGNMSFENVVARPASGDATVVMALDDGDTAVGQQVYLYRGTKANAGNPVEKAGLTNGKLYGVKVLGIPQSEYQKTDWEVGEQHDFELVDVSQYAGIGGSNGGAIDELEALIRPAIARPARSPLIEDYSILRVERLDHAADTAALAAHPVVQAALLGERRRLSPSATQLLTSLSYYPDDLALLSWNGAVLIDPDPLAAATAANLIEFANVQLLLLRSYDAQLDAQLPAMYCRISAAQRRFALPLVRPVSRVLHDLQRLLAEITEVTERIDNAFKVTDDVYWNRLYSAMLSVLRVQTWRDGVDHKLVLLRETYRMLHDQADAERANALEWII